MCKGREHLFQALYIQNKLPQMHFPLDNRRLFFITDVQLWILQLIRCGVTHTSEVLHASSSYGVEMWFRPTCGNAESLQFDPPRCFSELKPPQVVVKAKQQSITGRLSTGSNPPHRQPINGYSLTGGSATEAKWGFSSSYSFTGIFLPGICVRLPRGHRLEKR